MDVDDTWQPQQPSPLGAAFEPQPDSAERKLLDIVFIQDCTGSQGSYIASATKNIQDIYSAIVQSGKLQHPEDFRIGLIAFRDHPPQDNTYITRNFGFSSNPTHVQENLKTLYAAGGGDGPEAVTAALGDALEMDWRADASKMVVLIADAPPHGIGEYGDGFSEGSPDHRDPLQIVRQMAIRGITLFFVACEPALSGYQYATDFYQAITAITSGLMLPLTTANLLAHAIIGSVLENMDMDRIVREVGQAVAQRILGNNESVDDVARELHEKLLLRNESTKKLIVENIYRDTPEAKHNVEVFTNAASLAEARPFLKKVKGPRFTDKYLQAASARRAYSPYAPRSYPKPSTSASSGIALPTPTSSPVVPPTSPPRKVVTDFKTFSSPTSTSVASTAVSGGGGAGIFGARPSAFSGMRGGGMFNDDDDDEDAQRIELGEGNITLDQARRIAMQSAWRGLGS